MAKYEGEPFGANFCAEASGRHTTQLYGAEIVVKLVLA